MPCTNLLPAVLWLSLHRSHYHLQGQGGGGGAACGEGGHYHLRVDGLLPLLRVHAQHRHLRPGQMAGTMVLLKAQGRSGLSVCVCVAGWTNKVLTLAVNPPDSDEVEDLLYAFAACVCCPDAEDILE